MFSYVSPGNSGSLTCVRHISRKSSATQSCQRVQYLRVSNQKSVSECSIFVCPIKSLSASAVSSCVQSKVCQRVQCLRVSNQKSVSECSIFVCPIKSLSASAVSSCVQSKVCQRVQYLRVSNQKSVSECSIFVCPNKRMADYKHTLFLLTLSSTFRM